MTFLRTAAAAAILAVAPLAALAQGQIYHLAIHVDQADAQVMNMALNNAQNVHDHYAKQGDRVMIELVAYGPGLQMLVEGQSPVADRISTMSLALEDVSFSACGNTLAAMEKKKGGPVALMSEAKVVPSGVVRLMELQSQGYSYVRP